MRFHHSPEIWERFPTLAAITLPVTGVRPDLDVTAVAEPSLAADRIRLAGVASESELLEIQAQRCAFGDMGLKPTQYRCAAEALVRRFRKGGALAQVHPLVNLCNAVSIADAIPIAVFDLDHADSQQRAHARRWTSRQAATSAIRPDTSRVLINAETVERRRIHADTAAGAQYDALAGDTSYRTWRADRPPEETPAR